MSPRTTEQNQQIKNERRAQILNAALRVFARKGFSGTKMSDIAAEAGLSYGLTYHYFNSKDEIFTELVKYATEASSTLPLRAGEVVGSPLDKIRWMTERIIESIKGESPYYFLIMIQTLTSDAVPAEARELASQKALLPLQNMVPLIAMGQESGEITKDDPYALAMAYFSLLQGLALIRIEIGDSISPPNADTILRLLKA